MWIATYLTIAVASAYSGNVGFQTDVFVGGAVSPWGTKYACFRVPSIVRPASGALLAFVESRIPDCGDQAPKDITMRRSEDGGKTWGPLTLVVSADRALRANFTARNPYAVVTEDNVVILNYVDSTTPDQWTNYQVVSHDEGTTWNPASRVALGQWEGVLMGSGTGTVLGRACQASPYPGRIVGCGATGYQKGHDMFMPIWISDDNGASYTVTHAVAKLEECQAVELNNGSVVINARTSLSRGAAGCDCRASVISHDGGESWSDVYFVPDLEDPVCMAGLISDHGTLFFSNPATPTARVNMTLKQSTTQGGSWQVAAHLWAGPSAYSCLVPVTASSVGVLYERGARSPYENMTFALVDV